MANIDTIKNNANLVKNETEIGENTAARVGGVLVDIADYIGDGYMFAGIATPSTNPGVPDGNVFYLATEAGTYSNFNGIEIVSGEAVILEWRGSWTKKISGFATQEQFSELKSKTFKIFPKGNCYIDKRNKIHYYNSSDLRNGQGIAIFKLKKDINFKISNIWHDDNIAYKVYYLNSDRVIIGHSDNSDIINSNVEINSNNLINDAPDGSEFFALVVKGNNSILYSDVDLRDNTDLILNEKVYILNKKVNSKITTVDDFIAKGLTYTEQDGYFSKLGTYVDTDIYHSKTSIVYRCEKGYKFLYKGLGNLQTASWVFYKNNSLISYGQAESLYDYTEVIVPDGVDSIIFSSYALKGSNVILDVKFDINSNSNNCNILDSKKWYCCGDSYSEGDYTDSPNPENTKFTDGIYAGKNKVYSRFIALRNNMDLQLLAKCGATCGAWKEDVEAGTVDTPTYANTFYHNQLPQILAKEDETFNGYITLWFCINDGARCTLGTIDDETVNTFYGALNWSAIQLITNFPLAKIGFIVSNNANSSYQQAVRDVAQKWAIPYLDMEGDTQIPTISGKRTNQGIPVDSRVRTLRWNNTFRVAANNGHPNEKAHEYQSTFIENWLRSL